MATKKRKARTRSDKAAQEAQAPEAAEQIADDEEFESQEPEGLEEDVLGQDDEELTSRLLRAFDGIVPGVVRRATSSGVAQALLNEERVRTLLSENKKLPKEVAGLVFSQADGLRKEVLRTVSREIRVFLENVDLGGELAKILTSVSFEVKTEVRFIPNDQGVRQSGRKTDDSSEELGDEGSEPRAVKLRWGTKKRSKASSQEVAGADEES